jgi:hypothetical protein
MTPAPLPRDVAGQPGRAAGIGAVALAVLVAIAVAGLFLVLIGADRSDRLVAPNSDVADAQLAKPQAPASRSRSSASAERWLPPRSEPARHSLNNQQHR